MDKLKSSQTSEPWLQSWPLEDLESVQHCPACGRCEKKILYTNLVDKNFLVAAGKWSLWQCRNCNSAYLDQRPSQSSIGRAYETYFTHKPTQKEDPSTLGKFRFLRRALANGYLNQKYGTQHLPASRFGPVVATLLPSQRDAMDAQQRWLPKPRNGQRLLDVGLGSGGFLLNAIAAGWDAEGVDPDPTAINSASKRGLKAYRGGIDAYSGGVESLDALTISHVIEHVHEPRVVLKQAYKLLKPGGVLYLDTPNIESHGHRRFGRNWLHLDPPRHLVIFSRKSLNHLLCQTGFSNVEYIDRPNVSAASYIASSRLERGLYPFEKDAKSAGWKSRLLSLRSRVDKSGMEYLTLLAKKP